MTSGERRAGVHVLAIAHSAAGFERAGALLGERHDAALVDATRALELRSLARKLVPRSVRVLYLVDIGRTTAPLALLGRALGRKVVVDTGDLVFALERSRGSRGQLGLAKVWAGEQAALRAARLVVVRGRRHLRYLPHDRALFAPDLAPENARPVSGAAVRDRLGLGDAFIIGLVGSINSAPRLGTTYGWDVVESLRHVPDARGLIVGDGDGLEELRLRAERAGVAERCRFVGRVPSSEVAEYVAAMNVAVSTQTNDPPGQVRTTGKLPLYLACGCPVLATDVGEARDLLGPLGWTIPYEGTVDHAYPKRLARRVKDFAERPEEAEARRSAALRLHAEAFDRALVRKRVEGALDSLLETG